jgi:hypothetical protein
MPVVEASFNRVDERLALLELEFRERIAEIVCRAQRFENDEFLPVFRVDTHIRPEQIGARIIIPRTSVIVRVRSPRH